MHRKLTPVVFLFLAFSPTVFAQKMGKNPTVRLAIGPEGGVRIFDKTAFGEWSWDRTPDPGPPIDVEATWVKTVRLVMETALKAPRDTQTPEKTPAATMPIMIHLRWNPAVKKCKVYVGRVLCNYDVQGIERAGKKIEEILAKGQYDVAVSAGEDVPAKWVLAALDMASKKKPRRILFLPPSIGIDLAFENILALFPPFDPQKGRPPRAEVLCVIHPDAPFKAIGRLLLTCVEAGISDIKVGSSAKTLIPVSDYKPGRSNLLAGGGSRRTESAVYLGMIWLREHQNPDGSWSCRDFSKTCKHGSCGGAGASEVYTPGVTALALLAYLGAGHTHMHGRFKKTVLEALKAMKAFQGEDGCFGPKDPEGRWIYNHILGTLALAEAYGLSNRSELLKPVAQRAVDFLVECGNPGKGWGYGRRPGESDTSCTAWAVSALKGARISGLKVAPESFGDALNWFDAVTDKSSWRTGYKTPGDRGAQHAPRKEGFAPGEGMTAAALFARILIQGSRASGLPAVEGGGNLLKACLPKWDVKAGTIDMTYWFWGTNTAFQLGDPLWTPWNDAMKKALVPAQQRKGCAAGSWDPVGAWGAAGGRVYSTAISILTLEVYYRYGKVLKRK
ncbi:MAG: hypothetical protein ACYTHM_13260 [Planctomycetota bacterium]